MFETFNDISVGKYKRATVIKQINSKSNLEKISGPLEIKGICLLLIFLYLIC
jgi:hypothetical protein